MARVNITVCDKCRTLGKLAKNYTIKLGGKVASLDLCDEDAAPLLELLELGDRDLRQGDLVVKATSDEVPPRPEPRKHRRPTVATLEEIEAMKLDGTA